MEFNVSLKENSYPVIIEPGCTKHLEQHVDLSKKTFLVTDDGIPQKWVERIVSQMDDCPVFCFPNGESSKNFDTFQNLLMAMADAGLDRSSQVIALGGGVCSDMAGFAAACYMRGIDYIGIPTTVLSQVDSSVGGKTAIDLGKMKNLVGAFKQPKAVLIDPELLTTLPERQVSNGLAEALKMGLLFDADLVDEFEKENPDLEKIIARSIDLKRQVVEQDEKESGLRRALNFGHTIGHAIEGSFDDFEYLHGECIAAGMLYFITDPALKERVIEIEGKLNLPQIKDFDKEKSFDLLCHDKKSKGDGVWCVFVNAPGSFEMKKLSFEQLHQKLQENPYEKQHR